MSEESIEKMMIPVQRAVFEEYWHVLDIGLIVPNLESKWSSWFFNLRALLSGVTMALMAGNFLYTCIAHADNLGLMAFSLHMSILGIIGLGVLICSIKDRYRGIRFVHHFVVQMRDHCVYADCEYNKELIKKRGQLKRKLAIFWPVYYGLTFVVLIVISPYIDSYLGTAPVPNESGDGFAMTLALPCWSPFDADHSTFGFIVTFAFELGYIAAILIPVSAGIFFYLGNQLAILDHLRLLRHSLGELDKRAAKLHKSKYPGVKIDKYSTDFDDCYYECLRDNIRHHQYILKAITEYQAIMSIPLFIPFLGASMLIALSGAHIISDDPKVAKKINEGAVACGEILLMVLTCVLGEELTHESENLFNAFYDTKWYNRSTRVKKAISIGLYMTTQPIVFKVGNLVTLNNSNLGVVMNSAYSTFNLFYATQQEK
ncbi:Odorant receptor [Nesidiocoris tenuis]|uniref:Odorant receptor n=1 Tax=Nesidiocoris tenuis TaxID=355587 RepID=A0ABN7BI36_9HEMI|nr:Odorant receptor [Nesidiocoris tenuis]